MGLRRRTSVTAPSNNPPILPTVSALYQRLFVVCPAGRMLGELRSKGLTIGITDAIIAATALELGTPLLTNNVEHYPFPDLKVIRGLEI